MSGLVNKSLPFTSDGYYAVASKFDLPFQIRSREGNVLLQLEPESGSIGKAEDPKIIVDVDLIIQLVQSTKGLIGSADDPAVIPANIVVQTPKSGVGTIGGINEDPRVVDDGTATYQIRSDYRSIGNIKLANILDEVGTYANIKYPVTVKFGSSPFKA